MPAQARSNELTLTRLYDAPLKAVWDAWTDPKQAAQWWGPRGFTITTHSKDLRPGGTWHYTMHGPDGIDYPNKATYLEVEPHARLVYDHGGYDDRPPLFRVTVLFREEDGKTRMEMSMRLPTPEAAEEARRFIKKAGGDSTWDRLGEYLEKQGAKREIFLINRRFDAPVATVFEMWTNPEHLTRWLPPSGLKMEFLRGELRMGSTALWQMTGPNFTMHGHFNYLEVCRPDRLVYTQQFCDAQGNLSRHPMMSTWPATMLTTVNLTEEGPGRTRVTVRSEPHGATTEAELQAFLHERAGMTQGWTESFDKFEALLGG